MIRFDKGVSRKGKEWDVICPPFIIIYIYLIIVPFSKVSLSNFIVANCVYSYPRRKVEWIDTINLAHLTRQLNPHCYIQSEQLLRKERDVSVPQHHSDSIIAQFPFTFVKSRSLWFNIVLPMFRLIVNELLIFFYFLFTILISYVSDADQFRFCYYHYFRYCRVYGFGTPLFVPTTTCRRTSCRT